MQDKSKELTKLTPRPTREPLHISHTYTQQENETREEFKGRRKIEAWLLKRYLKGRMIWRSVKAVEYKEIGTGDIRYSIEPNQGTYRRQDLISIGLSPL